MKHKKCCCFIQMKESLREKYEWKIHKDEYYWENNLMTHYASAQCNDSLLFMMKSVSINEKKFVKSWDSSFIVLRVYIHVLFWKVHAHKVIIKWNCIRMLGWTFKLKTKKLLLKVKLFFSEITGNFPFVAMQNLLTTQKTFTVVSNYKSISF